MRTGIMKEKRDSAGRAAQTSRGRVCAAQQHQLRQHYAACTKAATSCSLCQLLLTVAAQ